MSGKARKSYVGGWRLYPWCMAGHHVQGAGVAVAASTGQPSMIAIAALWTVLYVGYQALSVLRKQDSPGLDIADFMMGFGIGCGVAALTMFFGA